MSYLIAQDPPINLWDAMQATHDRPLAAKGLISYRCRGRYGWIMIGAKDDADAMREALRSDPEAKRDNLQVWSGARYAPALEDNPALFRK